VVGSAKRIGLLSGRVAAGALIAAVLLVGAPGARGDENAVRVAVVYGPSETYERGSAALIRKLEAAGRTCTSIALPVGDDAQMKQSLAELAAFKPTLIAAGGTAAALHAIEAVPDVPVVFFMVPNGRDAPFMAAGHPGRGRVCGVAADVSPDKQIEWVRRTHPTAGRIAVLCSERTRETAAAIERAGRERGLHVVLIRTSADRFVDAVKELDEARCDGVLMIPDSSVYNSATVKRLLVWGARNRKAVWTFSRNVVKAGAFSGLCCDSEAVGRQAADLVERVVQDGDVHQIGLQYPQETSQSVNVHTAKMIGVEDAVRSLPASVERFGDR
jgi:ABC-type uncharacterized transport system substrate-binding protein